MTSAAFSPETAGTIVYTAEFGSPPSATELNVLSQFAQAQFAYGQQIGVMDPTVYAYEALGVALASTGANFQNTFGPAVDGDVQFVVDAYASVFGQPGSGAQIQQFSDQLNFFEGLYTAAGVFGSASNIDLLARGAVYGQMLGVEHESTLIGSPPGGTTFTAPPDQNNLVLNNGDVLNVNNLGTAGGTTVNSGGVVDVTDGGQAIGTSVNSGGVMNVNSGGQAHDTFLTGGVVNVNAGGMAHGTDIIFGGVENVFGVSNVPKLEPGGVENVVAGGTIAEVLLEGGVLQLSDPTQLSGMIVDESFSPSVIDFVNTNVTNFTVSGPFRSFQLVLTYGNNQTITYQGTVPGPNNGTFLSPTFALQHDGHGGTNLIVSLAVSGDEPTAEAQSSMDVIGIQHQLEHPAV